MFQEEEAQADASDDTAYSPSDFRGIDGSEDIETQWSEISAYTPNQTQHTSLPNDAVETRAGSEMNEPGTSDGSASDVERVLMGNASRFVRAVESSPSVESISISSRCSASEPEAVEKEGERHVRKNPFHSNKRRAPLPIGYDASDPDWQYNSYLKKYEHRPGMDIWSVPDELYDSLMQAAREEEDAEYFREFNELNGSGARADW